MIPCDHCPAPAVHHAPALMWDKERQHRCDKHREHDLSQQKQLAMSNERLIKALSVLDGYETWEANLLMDNRAWEPNGMSPFPTLNRELWDGLIGLQKARNEVLYEEHVAPIAVRPSRCPTDSEGAE